jgi:integrase/recombinase XerD
MIVSVWTRHSSGCDHREDINYRRCGCPKHLHWHHGGRQFRKSARTRSWEHAWRKAQAVELEYRQRELGEKPQKHEAVTVERAVELYLADKCSQRLQEVTLKKLETIFRKRLLAWCNQQGIYFLFDLDLSHLREWRSTWQDGPLASKKKQERVRGFFYFCHSSGWIQDNPATGLSRIKVDQRPTDYFTRKEFARIIDSTYLYDSKSVDKKEMLHNSTRLRTMTWLLRYSGLAIRDAITLERSQVDDRGRILLYRAKTGVAVYLPLPSFVARSLRDIPPGPKPNPRYFFWSGNGDPKSAVADWQRAYRKLFRIANINHADGSAKRCFPHMFRDTFAVEALLAGVPLEDVSLYLGHSSIKTTERHYAPFVKARQQKMVETLKKAWAVMGVEKARRRARHRSGTS